eukprot:jgi/Mesvir1/27261/Mv07098-RA.1
MKRIKRLWVDRVVFAVAVVSLVILIIGSLIMLAALIKDDRNLSVAGGVLTAIGAVFTVASCYVVLTASSSRRPMPRWMSELDSMAPPSEAKLEYDVEREYHRTAPKMEEESGWIA